ncbi:hypothetical protein PV328_002118 [Microctonus aethiopoides]|uniref:PPIase cyclophilin-type domain-containing protein n=1 Tax=Microctonus aethiopoides TaxID=144406 RepID=A0AA39FZ26_9HYME|nr:hypothetical protein PV328_002118 [Microctonus aethiopoides]
MGHGSPLAYLKEITSSAISKSISQLLQITTIIKTIETSIDRDNEYSSPGQSIVIKINGIINQISFQKAKWCALMLQNRLPWTFAKPEIHEMFQMEWHDYLANARRDIGGRMWILNRSVAVFINDKYIGSDIDFINYVNEIYVICLPNNSDFYENLIANDLRRIIESSRKFIFFTFNINGVTIGSFLFMLYSDLLPQTCEYFLNLCVGDEKNLLNEQKINYKNSTIHRIVKSRWLQMGDIGIHGSTETITTPDESYCIAHDRCGVLSLSNNGNHRNGPQFIVSLNPNPWMDGNYLAFGQLVDGVKTLKKIEEIPTYYEAPMEKIIISQCRDYNFSKELQLEINQDVTLDNEDLSHEEIEDETQTPLCTTDNNSFVRY